MELCKIDKMQIRSKNLKTDLGYDWLRKKKEKWGGDSKQDQYISICKIGFILQNPRTTVCVISKANFSLYYVAKQAILVIPLQSNLLLLLISHTVEGYGMC